MKEKLETFIGLVIASIMLAGILFLFYNFVFSTEERGNKYNSQGVNPDYIACPGGNVPCY